MQDKICLITGGTSGIGRATAIALARMGATVVLAARSVERGEHAVRDICRESGQRSILALPCDLSCQRSIRRFSKEFRKRFDRLDVLLHSGAAVFPNREITSDGVERNFAVAYLSIFLLSTLLSDMLIDSAPSRIVIISGEYHRKVSLDFANLMGEKHFSMIEAGSRAALSKVVLAKELSRRLGPKGVSVNSLHPGAVRTNLLRNLPWYLRAAAAPVQLFFASPEKGARTPIYLASSADVEGVSGKYFIDCKPVAASVESQNEEVATKLWLASEALIAGSSNFAQ